MRISLEKLVFFGYHGVYAEEKKIGNTFEVDVAIDFPNPPKNIHQLDQTIDYVQVYGIVKKWMEQPTALLETIVGNIADDIFKNFLIAQTVSVKITKQTLPIESFEGSASVTIEKSRN